MPPTPRVSFLCGRKKYSSHQARYFAYQAGSKASQAPCMAAWKSLASSASWLRCSSTIGVRSAPPPNQLTAVDRKRVFMCTVGTRGERGWTIRLIEAETYEASVSVPGMVAAISGEKRAVAAEVCTPAFSNSRPLKKPPMPPPTPVSRVQGLSSKRPNDPELGGSG